MKQIKIFDYDGPLVTAVRYIGRMYVFNFIFMVTCLPVVTIGTAITAMYACYINEPKESGFFRNYFRAFKENFKTTIWPWLGYLSVLACLVLNLYFMLFLEIPGEDILLILFLIFGIVWLATVLWFFAMRARYNATVMRCFKTSILLGFGRLPITLLSVAMWFLLPVCIIFFNYRTILIVGFIYIQFGFSLAGQLSALLIRRVLYKVEKRQ